MSAVSCSPLGGRVALVTGASRRIGLGFAIARRLLTLGADLSVQSWTSHDARSGRGTLAELSAEEVDSFLHENVRASLLLVKEFAAQHDGRSGGRVVLLTSGQHLAPMAGEIAYAVSKGALHQATRTLSDALIDRGITVNAVNPGLTDTGWIGDRSPAGAMPLGRWGEPDDCARLIGWLCTDDARWISGQVIDSEGGFRR